MKKIPLKSVISNRKTAFRLQFAVPAAERSFVVVNVQWAVELLPDYNLHFAPNWCVLIRFHAFFTCFCAKTDGFNSGGLGCDRVVRFHKTTTELILLSVQYH